MATMNSNRLGSKPVQDGQESWTQERRDAATPKPLPIVDRNQPPPAAEVEPVGDLGSIEGQQPTNPPKVPQVQKEALMAAASTLAQPVADPLIWPYVCTGKLFLSQGGTDYVGSAVAITNNIILTAGHCAYHNGNWSEDVEFYPGYPILVDPVLRVHYGANYAVTYFDGKTAFQYDFALMWVPAGMRDEIGSIGVVYNDPPTNASFWHALGYPADSPFPGDTMYSATGSSADTGDPMEMSNNDMTPGCSGGPWLMTWSDGKLYVNGVNSFRYDDSPTTMYSPQLLTSFLTVYNYINANHP